MYRRSRGEAVFFGGFRVEDISWSFRIAGAEGSGRRLFLYDWIVVKHVNSLLLVILLLNGTSSNFSRIKLFK